mmetsp:Transcript_16382/g.52086  ORF Transcript_16382/g.52086 Transcript_16382/m.52086 type:complete len:271 (-) Transcript_16382:75-887(-)
MEERSMMKKLMLLKYRSARGHVKRNTLALPTASRVQLVGNWTATCSWLASTSRHCTLSGSVGVSGTRATGPVSSRRNELIRWLASGRYVSYSASAMEKVRVKALVCAMVATLSSLIREPSSSVMTYTISWPSWLSPSRTGRSDTTWLPRTAVGRCLITCSANCLGEMLVQHRSSQATLSRLKVGSVSGQEKWATRLSCGVLDSLQCQVSGYCSSKLWYVFLYVMNVFMFGSGGVTETTESWCCSSAPLPRASSQLRYLLRSRGRLHRLHR